MVDLDEQTENKIERLLTRVLALVRRYKVELLLFFVGFLLGVWV